MGLGSWFQDNIIDPVRDTVKSVSDPIQDYLIDPVKDVFDPLRPEWSKGKPLEQWDNIWEHVEETYLPEVVKDNPAQVISAIVLAPFTGGQSLWALAPYAVDSTSSQFGLEIPDNITNMVSSFLSGRAAFGSGGLFGGETTLPGFGQGGAASNLFNTANATSNIANAASSVGGGDGMAFNDLFELSDFNLSDFGGDMLTDLYGASDPFSLASFQDLAASSGGIDDIWNMASTSSEWINPILQSLNAGGTDMGNIAQNVTSVIKSLTGSDTGQGGLAGLPDWLKDLLQVGGAGYAGYQDSRAADRALQLQRDIADPQIDYMKYLMGKSKEVGNVAVPKIISDLSRTSLDPITAGEIGKYFGREGEQLGINLADRGTLASGTRNRLATQLGTEKAGTLATAFQTQQSQGMTDALSFLGRSQPPGIAIPQGGTDVDWGAIGGTFNDLLNRKSPVAAVS